MLFRPPIAAVRQAPWRRCGENTAAVTCFSFYANKTMTTGEGGMAVTDDDAAGRADAADVAARTVARRLETLHAATAPGTIASSPPASNTTSPTSPPRSGNGQIAGPRRCAASAKTIAREYLPAFADLEQIELPPRSRRPHPFLASVSHPSESGPTARWTATRSSRRSVAGAWAAPFTGGRCTCIPTTKRRSAGGRSTCRWLAASGRGSSVCRCSRACGRGAGNVACMSWK